MTGKQGTTRRTGGEVEQRRDQLCAACCTRNPSLAPSGNVTRGSLPGLVLRAPAEKSPSFLLRRLHYRQPDETAHA